MIFASFLLFALTILAIFYPLTRSKSAQQEVTLQDIYQKNYLATEKRLSAELANGQLTQAEYDIQNAEAARDLLKISQKNGKNLSQPARLLVVLITLLFPLLAIGGFWAYSYTPETRTFDTERARLINEFTEWREVIPTSELDSLNGILAIEPQPRDPEIFNQLKYGFPALFFMSAKDTHDNIPTLKLLGKLLYDVKWLSASHEVYTRVLSLSPTDFIANAMIIDIEMQSSNNKITPTIQAKMDRFFALYPAETSMRVMYAQALYDNQMIEKSVEQWRILRELFAQNRDPSRQEQVQQTLQAIDMIITSVTQQAMETTQVRNYVINLQTFADLDWDKLSTPSILTLYMIDQEDNTSVAYKEILITPDTQLPTELALNDFNRFDDVKNPIRSFEHLAVFAEITNIVNGESVYVTDLSQLAKGAYESAVMFEVNSKNRKRSEPMQKTVDLVNAQKDQRFLIQVNAPNVDLSTLPEEATLNLFISPAGSRMPLAAKKIPSAKNLTFPLTIAVTDANKLMEGTPSLFTMENLEIGGRLSMGSDVVGKAGDIESTKQMISPSKVNIITLDQIREESKASPMVQ
ncbi:c-type cytochrome biogenesis protein CcmI [Wohlfahrtiimonas larvae]|uniref:Cytochrome c-type biogenesis protein H Ig-like domain-containing protein n=1 Tax=Wohlfahrtiimonas larvae TaxID=1157986 RepID=A0ABP9MUI6_9GAMM|nr:c-type cytochrome biogenesis protein CcmI [Wohlfahrtiimonas larvae]